MTTKRAAHRLRLFGIEVQVHWTFLLLLGWFFAAQLLEGEGLGRALRGLAFTTTVFACVVLHELGHALTARHFNIQTRRIVLYPIGGVAQLERLPDRPREELWVAIAGPLVSFAIAGVFLLFVQLPSVDELSMLSGNFAGHVAYMNLSLGLFNLLPALPMDGGRILHAVLGWRLGAPRATAIASSIGKLFAILMSAAGIITGQWMLLFIAGFVFITADSEARFMRTRSLVRGVTVREAMLQRFDCIDAQLSAAEAAAALGDSDQEAFPVLRADALIGVMTRDELLRELAAGGDTTPVSALAHECQTVSDATPLEDALLPLQRARAACLPVLHADAVVGLLTASHLEKWLSLHEAMRGTGRAIDPRLPRRV